MVIEESHIKDLVFWVGMAASFVIPFFNIPLILKIYKKRSSKDISLVWTFGVWICALLMLPQALLGIDLIFKIFCLVNFVLFSCVVFFVWRHR